MIWNSPCLLGLEAATTAIQKWWLPWTSMWGESSKRWTELQLREKTLIVFYADNGTPARTIIEVRDGRFVRQPVVSQLGDRQIPGGKCS